MPDPLAGELTLELATASRDRHNVTVDGTCAHCLGHTRWPCEHFERADRVIRALTQPEPAGFLQGDEYLQAHLEQVVPPPIHPAWTAGIKE
jgi:hypothetical protein